MVRKLCVPLCKALGCLLGIGLPLTVMSSKSSNSTGTVEKIIFDFTKPSASVSDWTEQSDTVRTVGMSKAAIVLQKTLVFQRAVFFTLLNPQPNGAGFAGMRVATNLDLSDFDNIELRVRGQGNFSAYKVVLRHRHEDDESRPTYEQRFVAPPEELSAVRLPLSGFAPFHRGRPVPEAPPLDMGAVTSFGLQVAGGVYLRDKQAGAAALEIEHIKATRG